MQEEKVVIITGASKGIGKATAELFAKNGFFVVGTYLKDEKAAQKVESENIALFKIDNKDSISINNLVKDTYEKHGRIDAVVANAAMTKVNLLQDMTEEDISDVVTTNLFGTIYLFRAVSEILIKQKQGSMVAVSSYYVDSGGACESIYAATKGGINSLVYSLAAELAPSGITVNAVSPGIVDTEMNSCYDKEELISLTPSKRLCLPEEIATTIFFLCSSKARFINGQIIRQHGGITL